MYTSLQHNTYQSTSTCHRCTLGSHPSHGHVPTPFSLQPLLPPAMFRLPSSLLSSIHAPLTLQPSPLSSLSSPAPSPSPPPSPQPLKAHSKDPDTSYPHPRLRPIRTTGPRHCTWNLDRYSACVSPQPSLRLRCRACTYARLWSPSANQASLARRHCICQHADWPCSYSRPRIRRPCSTLIFVPTHFYWFILAPAWRQNRPLKPRSQTVPSGSDISGNFLEVPHNPFGCVCFFSLLGTVGCFGHVFWASFLLCISGSDAFSASRGGASDTDDANKSKEPAHKPLPAEGHSLAS